MTGLLIYTNIHTTIFVLDIPQKYMYPEILEAPLCPYATCALLRDFGQTVPNRSLPGFRCHAAFGFQTGE